MTKKDKKKKSEEQKNKPRESKMAEKDAGESADDRLYDNVGLGDVKHCVGILEHMISEVKMSENKGKKDQDDHDHSEPSGPNESTLLPKLEEELKILKSKMKHCEKEEQEISNIMENKEFGIEQELVTMAWNLDFATEKVVQRISDMKKYKDSGSVDMDELETIRLAGEGLRERQQNPDGLLARLMRDVVYPADKGSPQYRGKNTKFTSQELKKIRKDIENSLITTEEVLKSLNDYEEKFGKYNVPKRDDQWSETLEQYLERLRGFMRSTWKEEAAKCRQKGYRSFIEWMSKLKQSEVDERRITFRALKVVFHDLGTKISRFLIEYFFLMSVSAEKEDIASVLFEVESIIKCLIIEENSVVISNLISVVELFDRTMRMAKPLDQDAKAKSKEIETIKRDDSQIEKENELLHLIIVEILRLEVSFSYPDLPMMLINEVYLAMGKHLVDNVFEDKLNRIGATIDGLKIEFSSVEHKDSLRNLFGEVSHLGVNEIWNELDLKPRAS